MKVYSVSEFRAEMNELFGQVTVAVQGEVRGFHISQNRFVWFSLADDEAVVDCFMMSFQLRQPLADGLEIRAIGTPNLFKKGKFVFRPRLIELVGEGGLRQEYERLKQQLTQEGLFDPSRKRELPRFPQRIALVTSKDAAAYTDVLRILKNRWSGLEILHLNVNVQGEQAVESIVGALHQLNVEAPDLDCIILTRGGGSLEDLHAFNSEAVVRAIFASRIPIVCGVGHERDISLADLAADVRAATPSNAAELVVPYKADVLGQIQYLERHLTVGVEAVMRAHQDQISDAVHLLDSHARGQLSRFHDLQQRLQFALATFDGQVRQKLDRVDHLVALLQSVNPQRVLKRGYTMTFDSRGRLIKDKAGVVTGMRLTTRFRDGDVNSTVQP
jgi:exodeoxyribonuclease VII large subunit